MDRIRAVIGRDSWLVQNFNTDLPRLNWSGYKEASYPGMAQLRVLHTSGGLDTL
jgi:N-sulfoglucosamine sulfohydrolase